MRNHYLPSIYAAICLCVCSTNLLFPADWNRFRGENGNGKSTDVIPLNWTAENQRWKVELPGKGNGSPIIVQGKIYLQTASEDGKQRGLACFDAVTGKENWHTHVSGKTAHIHAKNSLASSTPTCDGEQIYCVFWDGADVSLYAFDMSGKEKWKTTLGGYISQHGPGFSPVVHAGKVFVNYDQDKKASLIAFEAKTGSKVWQAERKAFRACYSTPFFRDSNVIISSTAGLTAYNLDSGSIVWNWDWKFDGMALRTVGSAIDTGRQIVAISGDGGGSRHTVVITPDLPGKSARLDWEVKKEAPYVPMPIVHEEYIYWVTDDGFAMAVELKTGKTVWKERAFNRSVSSSLLLCDSAQGKVVLAIAESGDVLLFKANPESFQKVGEHKLNQAVFASPAVADGRLIIRTSQHLICIGEKK